MGEGEHLLKCCCAAPESALLQKEEKKRKRARLLSPEFSYVASGQNKQCLKKVPSCCVPCSLWCGLSPLGQMSSGQWSWCLEDWWILSQHQKLGETGIGPFLRPYWHVYVLCSAGLCFCRVGMFCCSIIWLAWKGDDWDLLLCFITILAIWKFNTSL